MPTRRRFLLSCSALAITASAAPAIAFSAPLRSGWAALDEIRFQDFAAVVNTGFRVVTGSRTVELRLVGVKPAASSSSARVNNEDAGNEKFSLLFSGPVGEPLSQDTHLFEHQRIGRFRMFIVPVGPREQDHRCYEAVFNRPVPGGRPVPGIAGLAIPSDAARHGQPDKPETSQST
jgi:hypothetical protein